MASTSAVTAAAPSAASAPNRKWNRGANGASRAAAAPDGAAGRPALGQQVGVAVLDGGRVHGVVRRRDAPGGQQRLGLVARPGARGVGRALAGPRAPVLALGAVARLAHTFGQIELVGHVDCGRLRLRRVEQRRRPRRRRARGAARAPRRPRDGLAVVAHAAQGGEVGLPEDLRGGRLLGRVRQDGGDRVARHRVVAAGAVHDLHADALEALHDARARPRARRLVGEVVGFEVDRLGAHAAHADHPRGAATSRCGRRRRRRSSSRRRRRARRPSRRASTRACRPPRGARTRSAPPSRSPGGGRASCRACGSTGAWTARPACRRGWRRRGRPRGSRPRASPRRT